MIHTNTYDAEALKAAIRTGWRAEFLFFWGHTANDDSIGKHVLSQWWPATFSIDDEAYSTAEHYMMAEKAKLFGDDKARCDVLSAPTPAEAKALGRRVKSFDEQLWATHRFEIAVRGNTAKFEQNPDLKAWLIATGNTVLVEASPVDRVWGIGLAADDKRARDPESWRGLNLLGFAIMKARAAQRRSA